MNRFILALMCGVFVVVQCANAAYFLPLGHLPDSEFSRATDVSDDGRVVVGFSGSAATLPFPIGQAFRWTRDVGMTGLGKLPDDVGSIANGVSADGSVVVGSSFSDIVDYWAFRWSTDQGMTGLGKLPGNRGSNASAVSADGSVIVGFNHNGFMGGDRPAFRWTSADGMIDIGDLPGGEVVSSAYNISADGAVIVGSSVTSSGNSAYGEAFRWTSAEGMLGLGNLTGGAFHSQANGVSADGSVIVGYSAISADYEGEAFRWTSTDGMVGLGDLPGGRHRSYAEDVSANGSVVVGRAASASGDEAFVWDAAHGMRSVRDVLAGLRIDLTGWNLTSAIAISADCTTIVGNAINPSGQTEAWVANISAVPEPSVASILLIGAPTLAACRRLMVSQLRH